MSDCFYFRYDLNGSINLLTTQKISKFGDYEKSNGDLEEFTTVNQAIKMKENNLNRSNEDLPNKQVIRAKAIFKTSGQITSREERAKAIAQGRVPRALRNKSNKEPKTYAIDYTMQDDYLHYQRKNSTSQGWSPKRFKKYPRFTIFLNKGIENAYDKENSISLNPQFLNFLMSPEKAESASQEFIEALNLLTAQNLRKFDPFDKVVLGNKGIDNSILTSFRTLAKTNNCLSDTFKIIHQKFQAYEKSKSSFFNIKEAQAKSKDYLLNPPPDLSGKIDPPVKITDESLNTINQSYSNILPDFNTISHAGSKVATAVSGQRTKINDLSEERGPHHKSKPYLRHYSKPGFANYSTNYENSDEVSRLPYLNRSAITAEK